MPLHVSFLAAVLCSLQAGPDLGEAIPVDALDLTFRPPAGWQFKAGIPPTIARFIAPANGPGAGQIVLIAFEAPHAKALPSFEEEAKVHLAKELPSHKIVQARDVSVGGLPARILVVEGTTREGKDVTLVKTFAQRGLVDFLLIDGSSVRQDGAKITSLVEQVLGSVQFGLALTPEEKAGIVRLGETLGKLKKPASMPAEIYHAVTFSGQRLGYQRQAVRDEKSDGIQGVGFEMDMHLSDSQGGRKTLRSVGFFAPDASIQRVVYTEEIADRGGSKVVSQETLVLKGGEAAAVREVGGRKSDVRFAVPAGTLLSDVADILRGWIAIQGKGSYTLRTLPSFRDAPRLETLEVSAADRMKAHDGERAMVGAFAKQVRTKNVQYFFEVDGSMYRVASGKNPFTVQRCSREEALKP